MSSTNRGGERRKNDSYYTNPDLADFLVRLLVEDEWLDPDAPCRVLEPHAGKGAWIRAIRRHVPRAIITANDLVGDVSRCPECGTVHEVPPQRPAAVCVCRFSLPADDPRCFQLLELPVEQCAAVVRENNRVGYGKAE